MSTRTLAPRRTPARAALAAALLCVISLPGVVSAQEKPPQYYQVEVVVFLQPAGISAERPPREPAPADSAAAAETPEAPVEQQGLPSDFAPPRLERTLDASARALSRRGYQVLWHQAWIQPPAQRRGTDLALLAALGQGAATPALSGTVSLSAGRFLHLGMALEWQVDGRPAARMDQRRRIRPEAEQYFDHPRLGVLAVIRPVD
jgi:hypothetical protein